MLRKGLVLVLLSGLAVAAKNAPIPPLEHGILLAFTDKPYSQFIGGATTQSSITVTNHDFLITIAIGDIAYTASMGHHYIPKTMIMGDPIDAAVDAEHLYFKLPSGKVFRATITQRARYKPEEKK